MYIPRPSKYPWKLCFNLEFQYFDHVLRVYCTMIEIFWPETFHSPRRPSWNGCSCSCYGVTEPLALSTQRWWWWSLPVVSWFIKPGWWWLEPEFYDFPFSWEWKIIPTDELIFFRGVGIPPTRKPFKYSSILTPINLRQVDGISRLRGNHLV